MTEYESKEARSCSSRGSSKYTPQHPINKDIAYCLKRKYAVYFSIKEIGSYDSVKKEGSYYEVAS
jgi:hypothetical protein